ncbi:MAG: hypothetical protein AB3N09_13530, partial [Tateyamaria sp.]
MSLIRCIAALAVWLSATPVLAACPTAANLKDGIVTRTSDGDVEVHRQTVPGIIQVDIRFGDGTGDGSVMQFGQGLYLRNIIPIESGVMQLGQQEKFASDATLRAWAKPVPSARWSNGRADGGTARSGPMRSYSLDGCTYDSFEVTLTFADDPTYTETYTYLPTLGIGLLIKSVD